MWEGVHKCSHLRWTFTCVLLNNYPCRTEETKQLITNAGDGTTARNHFIIQLLHISRWWNVSKAFDLESPKCCIRFGGFFFICATSYICSCLGPWYLPTRLMSNQITLKSQSHRKVSRWYLTHADRRDLSHSKNSLFCFISLFLGRPSSMKPASH